MLSDLVERSLSQEYLPYHMDPTVCQLLKAMITLKGYESKIKIAGLIGLRTLSTSREEINSKSFQKTRLNHGSVPPLDLSSSE